MRFRVCGFAITVLCLILNVALAESGERKVQRQDLPAVVQKTVSEQSHGAVLKGFSEESENGYTYYEAEMTFNGRSKDVLIDSDGGIVEVEEQVDFDSLDLAVQEGLLKKAGSGKIGKVESLTKRGHLVAYEAKVLTNGKRTEIQVGPNGSPLDHEE